MEKTLQAMVTKEAANQAESSIKKEKQSAKDEEAVEVRIPVVLHLTFARLAEIKYSAPAYSSKTPMAVACVFAQAPVLAECDCGMIVV